MGLSPIPRSSLRHLTHEASTQEDSVQKKASLSIIDFIRSFDVKIERLSPRQFEYFLAARSLLPLVGSLRLPLGTDPQTGGADLCTPTVADRHDLRSPSADMQHSLTPSDRFTIGKAEMRDLPFLLPHQLCYPRDQLMYMLANGQLTRRVMLREQQGEDDVGDPKNLVVEHSAQSLESGRRQRAYLLLDVSQSMNGEIPSDGMRPDKRGVIARGLSLAFLCVAQERESLLHFRPFSSAVGERVSGAHHHELAALTKEILAIRNAGSTALQASLTAAACDLSDFSGEARIDVMLITDGVSHLTRNPLSGRHLRTFLIGDSSTERGEGDGVVEKLKDWSTSFHQIKNIDFDRLLTLRPSDLRGVLHLIEHSLSLLPQARSLGDIEDVENLLGIGKTCIEVCKPTPETNEQLQQLVELLETGRAQISSYGLRKEVMTRQAEFEKLCALYEQNLPEGFREPRTSSIGGTDDRLGALSMTFRGGGSGQRGGLGLLCKAVYYRLKRALGNLVGRWV